MRRLAFRAAHEVLLPGFSRLHGRLMRNLKRPLADLDDDQDRDLRAMVAFAYRHVPHYRRAFDAAKVAPETIRTAADLRRLPILTKDEVRAAFDSLIPQGGPRVRYVERATGGSTGVPLRYRLAVRDRALMAALLYRGFSYGGYELGDRMLLLGGSSILSSVRSGASRRLHETIRNVRVLSSFDMSEGNLERYAEEFEASGAAFAYGYAGSFALLARWLETHGRPLPPARTIFTTAETLSPPMRAAIRAGLGADVLDAYGLNDGGVTAFECTAHAGLHVDMERAVLEVVDEAGQPIEEGEGRIVATSLHNYAFPFLRYDTGDVGVATQERCPCGRPFRLLREVRGRVQDFLVTPEGTRVHGEFITHIFWTSKGIRRFRVTQKTSDLLVVEVVPDAGFDPASLDQIRDLIRSRSERWRVDFRIVDAIDETAAGKHRFVVNAVGR